MRLRNLQRRAVSAVLSAGVLASVTASSVLPAVAAEQLPVEEGAAVVESSAIRIRTTTLPWATT